MARVTRPIGRPPLPFEKRRSQRVVTFLTDSENKAVREIAETESKSLSQICYELIQKGLEESESQSRASASDEEPPSIEHKRNRLPRFRPDAPRPLLIL